MSFPRRSFLMLAVAGLASPFAHAGQTGPFRTIREGATERLMLEGHDAVAYFTRSDAVRGDSALQIEHAGVSWRFSSEENKAAFLRDPDRYMPQYGGYCSNGINYAIPGGGGGGPDTWRIYRGRLYVFGGQKSRDHFEIDTALNLHRADKYWATEIAGSNPAAQRLKRMIFRVPHYMSDAALQAQWEAGLAAGTLPVMPGKPQVVPAAL
jgi:YHS domain-containing protein